MKPNPPLSGHTSECIQKSKKGLLMIENIKSIPKIKPKPYDTSHNVQKAIDGDKAAFAQLIKHLENKLYRVSRSVLKNDADCADAIQEALIRAWLQLPKLRDHKLFEHWLVRIVLRECYRITKRRKFESLDYDSQASYKTDIDERLAIQEAVYSLDVTKRVPFVLHYIMGYKIYEIAHIMDMPDGTVKTRLMRARNELRDMLKEEK